MKIKNYIFTIIVATMLLAVCAIQARPIRDIRRNDSSGVPLLKDSIVTFTGIVSVATQFGNYGPAFVYDNTGGVAVYDGTVSQLSIGDSVTITGTVTLYSGLAEISSATLTRHSSGHTVNPQVMTVPTVAHIDTVAGYVENEGTLITLNQVHIPGASGNFAGNTNYVLQDSFGNSVDMRIDVDATTIVGVAIPTGYFNMTGAVSQYDNSAPYFNGYQVMPRNLNDLGITPPPPTDTIMPIDSAIVDADSNGIPDLRGTNVSIIGIVTAPTGVFSLTQTDIYVQDHTAGVNVFSFNYQPVELGDSVLVRGSVYFYRGKTEINNAVITILAHDQPLPEPIPITCAMMNQEPYEGSLVALKGVFTSAFLLTGNQSYLLVDSTGTCTMRIDGDGNVPGLVMVQDTFTVIGIKSQYTSDTIPPVNTGYQFNPRYPTDFSRTLNDQLPLLTIAEVQRPGPDGSSSAYEGQYVKVHGRITGPADIFTSGSSASLYIQDATNGANVYAPSVDASYSVLIDVAGTEWECIGRVTEYSGLTEIANGAMWLLDSVPQEIVPEVIPFNTAVTEGMESKLVEVTGQVIVEPSAAGGAMNFTIKNGTPGIAIRVVDAAGVPTNWVKKNKRVKVIGIVGQYDTEYPYNTGYQILVRFLSDLVDMTDSVPQAAELKIDTIFPNPFSPSDPDPTRQTAIIKINSPTDYKIYVEIFDMEGRLVKRLLTNNPGGYQELYWDGKNDSYEPLPIGIYIVNLKAVTPAGKDLFVRKPVVIATRH